MYDFSRWYCTFVQRIEAPVRGGEGAPGTIPDGGPPVGERLGQIDRILINNDGADEKAILGNGERRCYVNIAVS